MTWLFAAWRWIASSRAGQLAGVALAALAGVLLYGRSKRTQGRSDVKQEQLENEVEAHDRINHADTGAGVDDDERIKRLSRIGRGEWGGD